MSDTDEQLLALIDLLGRTGAHDVRIGFSPEDDGEPVVWYATATWARAEASGQEAAGALDPVTALLRLCEAVMDGGTCTHCERPTMVDVNPPHAALRALEPLMCVYRFDPELHTFRRSCEGTA